MDCDTVNNRNEYYSFQIPAVQALFGYDVSNHMKASEETFFHKNIYF
jgi:hypothetical protein